MSIPETVLTQINDGLRGKTVSRIGRGMGSFLDVEFGDWSIWVYMADWRIEANGLVVVGSADTAEFIDDAVARIGPLTVEGLSINDFGDTSFFFSGNIVLRVFATALSDDDSEAWMLNNPDGSVLGVGPSVRWSMESSTS